MTAGPVPDWPWVIPVPLEAFGPLPETVTWAGETFTRKAELHLTVLGRTLRAAVRAHPRAAALEAEAEAFAREVGPLLPARRLPECVLLREGDATTLVQRLHLPEHHALAARLRAAGIDVPDPVPHVTLWTRGTDKGIGVSGEAELRALRVGGPIPLSALLGPR